MNSKEPEVNSLARLSKLWHLLDRLPVHMPEETHPRRKALCITFVLVFKARGDHKEVADDEDTSDPTVFIVQSHDAQGVHRQKKSHKAMDIFRSSLCSPLASTDTYGGLFSKTEIRNS